MAKQRSLGFIGALGSHTCAALLGSEPPFVRHLVRSSRRLLAGRSARSQHPFHENEKYKFFYSLAIYRRRAPPPGWWGGSQYLRSPKLRFALFRRHSLEADARVTLIIECGLDAFVVTAWMTMPDRAYPHTLRNASSFCY
jgi:hypothetical protein